MNYEKLKLELDRLVYECQKERDAHNSTKNKMKVLEDKLEDKAIHGGQLNSKIEEKNTQLENINTKLMQ